MLLPPSTSIPVPPPPLPKVKLNEEQKLNIIKSNLSFINTTLFLQRIQEKKISDLIPDEKLYYTGTIIKINKAGKRQERLLVITEKALYNIKTQLLL